MTAPATPRVIKLIKQAFPPVVNPNQDQTRAQFVERVHQIPAQFRGIVDSIQHSMTEHPEAYTKESDK